MGGNGSAALRACGHGSELYLPEQLVVRLWATLPVLLLGVAADCVCVRVFCSGPMRAALVNWFLLALSVSDVLLLVGSFFLLSLPALAELAHSLPAIQASHFAMRFIYPPLTAVQTFNVYMTVMVSMHRYLGVCQPLRARRWISKAPVAASIVGAAAFALVFNAPRVLETRLARCHSDTFGADSWAIGRGPLLLSDDYHLYYTLAAYSLVMFVVPFALLIGLCGAMLRALGRSSSERRRMSAAQQRRRGRGRGTTVMLLAVVAAFLACNSLACLNNFVGMALRRRPLDARLHRLFTLLVEIGNLLVQLNSATPLLIYFTFGSQFRRQLLLLLGKENAVLTPHDHTTTIRRSMSVPNSSSVRNDKAKRTPERLPLLSIRHTGSHDLTTEHARDRRPSVSPRPASQMAQCSNL